MQITIHDATPNDVGHIRHVEKQGWLTTYPHEPLGITKEDNEAKLSLSKEEHDALIEKRKISVNSASYNERAIKFYESIGFRKTGVEPKSAVADLPSGKHIPEIEMVLTFYSML